jgi:hypothetical protein
MAAIGRHGLGCLRHAGRAAARTGDRCRGRFETLILDAIRHNLMRPELVARSAFNAEPNRARHAAE